MQSMQHKLGTCCQILDNKGKQYKDTIIGIVQQSALDKILDPSDYKRFKEQPLERNTSLSNTLLFKACQAKVLAKVKQNLQALKNQLIHVASYPKEAQMFRISSNLLPMFDHPQYKALYTPEVLQVVNHGLAVCKRIIDQHNIIVTCHPDQFNIVNSDKDHVRHNSFNTLYYHKYFMERLTTSCKSCINIHVTGRLDHIPEFDQGLHKDLVPWLSFENDDTNKAAGVYQTLVMCERYNIKMVYDIHHDLCENSGKGLHAQSLSVFNRVLETWQGQTPIFHVSDSRDPEGDTPKKLSPHSDYITTQKAIDFAKWLLKYGNTEVEAKAKNHSISKLLQDLSK